MVIYVKARNKVIIQGADGAFGRILEVVAGRDNFKVNLFGTYVVFQENVGFGVEAFQ